MRKDKTKAVTLRKGGASYSEISAKLGTPKSTLSVWLGGIEFSRKIKLINTLRTKKIWARNITEFNKRRAIATKVKKQEVEKKAFNEIKEMTLDELMLVGSALYWGERYKRAEWNAIFCNSDPQMIALMMRFFREVCMVQDHQFRPQVQIHDNIDGESANKFWAGVSGLPISQFIRPTVQISRASKRIRPMHRLPFGTFRIRIADVSVLYKIKGWIRALSKSTNLTETNLC